MAFTAIKVLFLLCSTILPIIIADGADGTNNYLDVETPTFFNYNSPLRQPDSLRSRPYFDFLSTLYRRDATKSELFRPYMRTRREADVPAIPEFRSKRAIVFRPLFVYKQQQIRKQETQTRRKRL